MYRIAEAKGVENLIAGAWGSRNYNILQFPQFQNFLGGFGKMFKQLIIARRDLNMSQVSHAFLLEKLYWGSKEVDGLMYHIGISLDRDLFHNWIAEAETKVVCGEYKVEDHIIYNLKKKRRSEFFSLFRY